MNVESIKQQRWFAELQENKRLQWLLLLVACIVLLSLAKAISDSVTVRQDEVAQQKQMVEKLLTAQARPLDESVVTDKADAVRALKEKALTAGSASVAEAQALKRIDALTAQYIDGPRATLINTEAMQYGSENFWQIRIEVRGKLDEKQLIGLLDAFDGSEQFQRLTSFQYRPKASSVITLVVDYLYLTEAP
ncbi:hypothetical protein [Alteromonas halophila]|uniref:Uncharacterized protein n=1 Tax=Alteromonas halophila TaxID=516698 RepID=A0A918JP67_9ALTE|nr:hypothetical protein [Alteromonas halophila]GGW92442.1 hypothetical protein GCM10007391_28520 [Alteromonas halophila]